jgi:hypothetical protein
VVTGGRSRNLPSDTIRRPPWCSRYRRAAAAHTTTATRSFLVSRRQGASNSPEVLCVPPRPSETSEARKQASGKTLVPLALLHSHSVGVCPFRNYLDVGGDVAAGSPPLWAAAAQGVICLLHLGGVACLAGWARPAARLRRLARSALLDKAKVRKYWLKRCPSLKMCLDQPSGFPSLFESKSNFRIWLWLAAWVAEKAKQGRAANKVTLAAG